MASEFRFKTIFALVLVFISIGISGQSSATPTPITQGLEVLVLQSYHKGFRWTDNVVAGIESALQERVDQGAVVHVEYMDTKNASAEEVFPLLLETYKVKFHNRQPQVVIVADDNALNFVLQHGDDLFPAVPVVFCGINNFQDERLKGQSGYTGVSEAVDIKATIDLALSLHPQTEHLVAISDSTPTGRINLKSFHSIIRDLDDVEIIDLREKTAGELANALRELPDNSIVFNLSFFRDSKGRNFSPAQATKLIRDHTVFPIYSFWDFYLGTGIIGGKLVSGVSQGIKAGEMALELLEGKTVAEIPILRVSPNKYMFDHGPLLEAGLSESNLPESRTVINRPESYFDVYFLEIMGTITVLLVMTFLIFCMAVNIFQRRKAQHELQSLFDNSQAGILHLKGGRIVYRANQRLADILGYSDPSDMKGLDVRQVHLSLKKYEDFGKKFYDKLISKQRINTEYQLRRRNGIPIWVVLSGKALDPAPVPDLNKGVVWVIDDISDRKRAEQELASLNRELENKVVERTKDLVEKAEELETANRQLRRLDEMKSAFLNTVSHDLRTPLTSIRGFAKIIQRDFCSTFCGDDQDAKEKKIGSRIQSNLLILEQEGSRLTRLINDFLDLSKIESGQMTWRDEPVNLSSVVVQATEMVQGHFDKNTEVTVRTEIANGLPSIMVDPDRLLQVMTNLLANAVKYTDEGEVLVRVSVPWSAEIQVEIKDSGIGIPSEELPHVFNKFHQVEIGNTLRDTAKGTGLGLAICKEIIDHYDGEIWVESTQGQGSTFVFTLPL